MRKAPIELPCGLAKSARTLARAERNPNITVLILVSDNDRHPPHRAEPKKRGVRRLRRRRRALGGHRIVDRNLQTQRRQSTSIADRYKAQWPQFLLTKSGKTAQLEPCRYDFSSFQITEFIPMVVTG
jgi:hypothetical protein